MAKKNKKEKKQFPKEIYISRSFSEEFFSADEDIEHIDEGEVALYELKTVGKVSRKTKFEVED